MDKNLIDQVRRIASELGWGLEESCGAYRFTSGKIASGMFLQSNLLDGIASFMRDLDDSARYGLRDTLFNGTDGNEVECWYYISSQNVWARLDSYRI